MIEATPEKVKTMPLEQVKLYTLNAKIIHKAYDYLWTMMEDSDRIDKIEFDPTNAKGIHQVARRQREGRTYEYPEAGDGVQEWQIFRRDERGHDHLWGSG